MRDKGVRVHYFGDLLAETLRIPEARAFVLDRVINDDTVGPTLVLPAREMAESIDADTLASYLVGGILKRDLDLPEGYRASLLWQPFDAADFVLAPLPNHLFQRDNSAWVYAGVSVHPMAKPARQRKPCTPGRSTTSTPGLLRRGRSSSSTTATTTCHTTRPPAKVATSWSSGTVW